MSIKKLVCAAVISTLPVFAQAATFFEGEAFLGTGANDTTATAQDVGTLTLSGIHVMGSRLLDIPSLPGGDSADFFKFVVSAPTLVALGVTAPTSATFGNDPVLGLYASNGVLIASDDDSGGGWSSFLSQPLAAGTYFAAVSGYADFAFTGGGSSNWVYDLTITAVPEPESYAMMMAGLGLLGLIARRRTKAQAAL